MGIVREAVRPMGRGPASALCASSESTQQGYFPESAHCGHCDRRRKYVDDGGKRAEGMEWGTDGDSIICQIVGQRERHFAEWSNGIYLA